MSSPPRPDLQRTSRWPSGPRLESGSNNQANNQASRILSTSQSTHTDRISFVFALPYAYTRTVAPQPPTLWHPGSRGSAPLLSLGLHLELHLGLHLRLTRDGTCAIIFYGTRFGTSFGTWNCESFGTCDGTWPVGLVPFISGTSPIPIFMSRRSTDKMKRCLTLPRNTETMSHCPVIM
jgi:hypothetical protein